MSEVVAWRAAREFASRLRDPMFRCFARSVGFRAGRRLVLALAEEPLSSVLDRVGVTEPESPVTVVVYRPGVEPPFSFVDLYPTPAA
ncbi:hypothetical protein [Actinocatenispora thailandica]|uniref:hypothetical protein n=1 Tax=Actinocatenispora thailandica TaxID=227318 RepID=UPI0019503B2D|nr:hypothetical protein [Actinocatenispora thailandica]